MSRRSMRTFWGSVATSSRLGPSAPGPLHGIIVIIITIATLIILGR